MVAKSRCYRGIYLEGLRKTRKYLVRAAGTAAEMRTAYVPDTNLKLYRYIRLFGRPDTTWLIFDQTAYHMTLS